MVGTGGDRWGHIGPFCPHLYPPLYPPIERKKVGIIMLYPLSPLSPLISARQREMRRDSGKLRVKSLEYFLENAIQSGKLKKVGTVGTVGTAAP